MSKSKNNGVDPQALIDRYGADTARLFVMFASPPEQTHEWSDSGVDGSHRFLRRLWTSATHWQEQIRSAGSLNPATLSKPEKALRLEIHTILKQANFDYKRKQYNTVVSAAMKMLNALEAASAQVSASVLSEGVSILLRALNPVVPHVTHTLWQNLGYAAQWGDLLNAAWPQVDTSALVQDEISLVLQINGKVRGSITVSADADRATQEKIALASEDFTRHANGQPAKKVIVVPGRLINIVI